MTNAPILWSVNLLENREADLTQYVASTKKLQMSTNISYLYPYIEWIVNVPATFIERGIFTIGQGFQFTFNDPKSESQLSYAYYIDSIKYEESSLDPVAPITLKMVLSTRFLFADKIMAKGYYGNVADIIEQMFKEELSESGAISSIKVTKGIDSPMKRFRTYQNAKDFIETRLFDSFRGEKESFTYIFSDLSKKLYALHVVAAETELPTFHAFHRGYHDITTIANLSQDSKIKHNIAMFESMIVSINENRELWQVSNSGMLLVFRTNTPKRLNELPVFRMFPPMSSKGGGLFPITSRKSKDYADLTKVYIQDDQNDYSKAYSAFSFERNSSLLDSLKITISVDLNLNMIAGHILKLYPPSMKQQMPYVASLFEGPWLITEASHVIQSTKGRTYLTLQATSLRKREHVELDSLYYHQS